MIFIQSSVTVLLFQVLMVHPVIRGVVTESDLDVLDYLLEVCYVTCHNSVM